MATFYNKSSPHWSEHSSHGKFPNFKLERQQLFRPIISTERKSWFIITFLCYIIFKRWIIYSASCLNDLISSVKHKWRYFKECFNSFTHWTKVIVVPKDTDFHCIEKNHFSIYLLIVWLHHLNLPKYTITRYSHSTFVLAVSVPLAIIWAEANILKLNVCLSTLLIYISINLPVGWENEPSDGCMFNR